MRIKRRVDFSQEVKQKNPWIRIKNPLNNFEGIKETALKMKMKTKKEITLITSSFKESGVRETAQQKEKKINFFTF